MHLRDHLEKLHYFFEVAKAGSIKAASETLHITQPSITKSIKILEEVVGRPLFIRQPRGMSLTEEGELLLKYCHELFSHLTDLEVRLESPKDPMAGSLRVGTYDSIAIYFWPQFLRRFLIKYPKLNLELTTGRSTEIQLKVDRGELDMGLIIEPTSTVSLNTVMLAKDSFYLYQSTQFKGLQKGAMDVPLIYMPDALAGENLLVLEKALSPMGHWGGSYVHYKTSSLESVKALVEGGVGVGLLPNMVARELVKRKKIKKVDSKAFPKKGVGLHKIGVVYSKFRENSQALTRILQELQNQSGL